MVDIHAHPGGSLPIGRRGENLARRVIFDLAPWRKCYGDGTVQLLHQRAGDADPYPCALTVEGDMAYWLIRAADVDKPGWGDAQLHYYVGETLAKSSAWRTLTADALGAPGETPPEPQQDWVEKVLAAGTAAEDAAGRAEEAASHPPYPSEETGTWWTWNAETGKYEDTGLSYVGSGGGGTTDHTKLNNRDAENQHPMSAITGLDDALAGKQPTGNYLTEEQDPTVPEWAKQPQKPAYTAQEVGALPDSTVIPAPYTLPIATETTLGGVKPVTKTDEMTEPVGVDGAGGLWAKAGSGGGGGTYNASYTVKEDVDSYFAAFPTRDCKKILLRIAFQTTPSTAPTYMIIVNGYKPASGISIGATSLVWAEINVFNDDIRKYYTETHGASNNASGRTNNGGFLAYQYSSEDGFVITSLPAETEITIWGVKK